MEIDLSETSSAGERDRYLLEEEAKEGKKKDGRRMRREKKDGGARGAKGMATTRGEGSGAVRVLRSLCQAKTDRQLL